MFISYYILVYDFENGDVCWIYLGGIEAGIWKGWMGGVKERHNCGYRSGEWGRGICGCVEKHVMLNGDPFVLSFAVINYFLPFSISLAPCITFTINTA